MINKIKISKSEKIILIFFNYIRNFSLTSLIILKNKCLFVKNYNPNDINLEIQRILQSLMQTVEML